MAGGFFIASAKRIEIRNFAERRLLSIPRPVRGLSFTHAIPARLMFPMEISAAQREVLFGSDDLRADFKTRSIEAHRDL